MRFWRVFFPLVLCLASCDIDADSRQLGGGYRLKRVADQQFALVIPHESGGRVIDEIGWEQPLIIARASGSDYWDLIDTAHAEHTQVSDADRKSKANLQKIATQPVGAAWDKLDSSKRLW